MPDTTYQYTFSDNLSNGTGAGAETGTISGTFAADYNTLLASGMVTVTTPEGTENFRACLRRLFPITAIA